MVHPTSPSLLVFIPHGDFEKHVNQRLGDALTSGLIKRAKCRELSHAAMGILPSSEHREAFRIHLNSEINPNVQPSFSNVQPSGTTSAAPFQSNSASSGFIAGSQAATRDLNDEVQPSSVATPSSTSSPTQFPPPTYVPTHIENPISTTFSTHGHVCNDSVPCCEPTSIVQSPPADKDKLALSSSSNLPEQCRRPESNWRLITIGHRKFTLPPLQSSVQMLPQPSDRKAKYVSYQR